MEKTVPERVHWAVETLGVERDDRLLEIGCGGGVAVSLICDRLGEGTITAIDRSPVMVDRATRLNANHIASGRASIHLGELEDVQLEAGAFTKVFAVNVNLFWTRSAEPELESIRRLLGADGALYLFYESPSVAKAAAIVEKLTSVLADTTLIEGPSSSLFAVVARR